MQSFEDKMQVKKVSSNSVVVISLGFNGCGDVLFCNSKKGFGKYSQYNTKEFKKNYPSLKSSIANVRQTLEQFIIEETKRVKIVELCVGALQQDHSEDMNRGKKNNNGSCFSSYKTLAKEKKWKFNEILLADSEDEEGRARIPALEPGSAMNSPMIKGPIDEDKKKILYRQIEHVADKYPNKKISFIFIDGQEGNFSLLKQYFEDRVIKNYLLSRIDELKLIQCNSEEMIKKLSSQEQSDWYIRMSARRLIQPQYHLTQHDLKPNTCANSRLLKILEATTPKVELIPKSNTKYFELFSPSSEIDTLRASLNLTREYGSESSRETKSNYVQDNQYRFFQDQREPSSSSPSSLITISHDLSEKSRDFATVMDSVDKLQEEDYCHLEHISRIQVAPNSNKENLLEVPTDLAEINYNYQLRYKTFVFFACLLTFLSCGTMFILSDLIKKEEDFSENCSPSF